MNNKVHALTRVTATYRRNNVVSYRSVIVHDIGTMTGGFGLVLRKRTGIIGHEQVYLTDKVRRANESGM
jgi:hypothetical protein